MLEQKTSDISMQMSFGYKDISKSWACCVLTRGMLIQDKASKKVILSLGHYATAAWDSKLMS